MQTKCTLHTLALSVTKKISNTVQVWKTIPRFHLSKFLLGFRNLSSLLNSTYLLWLKVTDDCINIVQDFINKWHDLSHLNLNKMSAAFLCYFYEGITSHILDAIVGF